MNPLNVRDSLAIYIHWPYCDRICPYCDFNIYKTRNNPDLFAAIMADLKGWRAEIGDRRITSVHFGGGTPSLLDGPQIERTLDQISRLWPVDQNMEVALEVNPEHAAITLWHDYLKAGITRLSLGVQTFSDHGLSFLGRTHSGKQGQLALEAAIDLFASVSADLIFGWAGQSLSDLKSDLDVLLRLSPHHISAYQLTIEADTAFGRATKRGQIKCVEEEKGAAMFELVSNRLQQAGYNHYEISNYGKPGHRSRHNMSYWLGDDYLGVGPGAHGRVSISADRYATIAHLKPSDYVSSVKQTGLGIKAREHLTGEMRAEEYVMMGLRITEGISLSRYSGVAGEPLPERAINALKSDGLLAQKGDRLCATEKGRLVLNKVTEMLLLG